MLFNNQRQLFNKFQKTLAIYPTMLYNDKHLIRKERCDMMITTTSTINTLDLGGFEA